MTVGLAPADRSGAAAAGTWADTRISQRRRWTDRAFWVATAIGLTLLIAPLGWVLLGVVVQAVETWQWGMLWHTTADGGISNAIVGTLVLLGGVLVVAGSIGIGCGLYIAETAPPRVAGVLRGASEVLSGVPSIVIGYVAYVSLVIGLHWGYSTLAAVLALSLLVVPYVTKSTELAVSQVPTSYREGAEALGMTRTQILRRIVLRASVPGMATGIVVALAISVGETAPLLYTASFSNGYPSGGLTHSSIGYLTYVAYEFWDEPSNQAHAQAHAAALVLVVMVLGLILIGRLIVRMTQRFSEVDR